MVTWRRIQCWFAGHDWSPIWVTKTPQFYYRSCFHCAKMKFEHDDPDMPRDFVK